MQGEEARRAGKQAPIRSSGRRTSEKSRVSWRAGGGLAADDASEERFPREKIPRRRSPSSAPPTASVPIWHPLGSKHGIPAPVQRSPGRRQTPRPLQSSHHALQQTPWPVSRRRTSKPIRPCTPRARSSRRAGQGRHGCARREAPAPARGARPPRLSSCAPSASAHSVSCARVSRARAAPRGHRARAGRGPALA